MAAVKMSAATILAPSHFLPSYRRACRLAAIDVSALVLFRGEPVLYILKTLKVCHRYSMFQFSSYERRLRLMTLGHYLKVYILRFHT